MKTKKILNLIDAEIERLENEAEECIQEIGCTYEADSYFYAIDKFKEFRKNFEDDNN